MLSALLPCAQATAKIRSAAKAIRNSSLLRMMPPEPHTPKEGIKWPFLMHVLVEPAHKELGDARTVLFGHHLVAIARQPHGLEPHERSLHTRLIEPLCDAMGIRTVIARLSGHVQDRRSEEHTSELQSQSNLV